MDLFFRSMHWSIFQWTCLDWCTDLNQCPWWIFWLMGINSSIHIYQPIRVHWAYAYVDLCMTISICRSAYADQRMPISVWQSAFVDRRTWRPAYDDIYPCMDPCISMHGSMHRSMHRSIHRSMHRSMYCLIQISMHRSIHISMNRFIHMSIFNFIVSFNALWLNYCYR